MIVKARVYLSPLSRAPRTGDRPLDASPEPVLKMMEGQDRDLGLSTKLHNNKYLPPRLSSPSPPLSADLQSS